jgi:glycosyltransferase involved in cell wall biosynthesis
VHSLNKLLRVVTSRYGFKQICYTASSIFTNAGLFNYENRKLNIAYQVPYTESSGRATNLKFFGINALLSDVNLTQRLNSSDAWAKDRVSAVKSLRVMMLGLRGFPDVQGGVESHVEHLAPLLVNLGCDLEVIVRSPHQKIGIGKKWCGVKFTHFWAPKSSGLEAIIHTFLGVLYAAIKRPDILHIHAIGPALMTPLARLLGLKVVVTHHGPDYDRQKWGGFARKILQLGEWVGMRFSNSRIVISSVIHDLVMRKHGKHSVLIRNGVVMPDTDISEKYLEKFGIEKNKYILLVSRFVPEKRHLDLINAFNAAKLENYKLVFVGSSNHPDAYVQSILGAASNNSNIVLTGFQTGDSLRSLYAHAALFVLPSSHEGLSISLLEALSYGLPVIASNIPANLELGLNPKCYFELGNIEELGKLIVLSINQPACIERRKTQRMWVNDQYNWRSIAVKTYEAYSKVHLINSI